MPSGGQIWNQYKWCHLVAMFATNASGAIWWPNLQPIQYHWNQFWILADTQDMDPRSVVPLAMFPQNLIHIGKYWSKRAFGGHQHLELVEPRWAVHLWASAAVPERHYRQPLKTWLIWEIILRMEPHPYLILVTNAATSVCGKIFQVRGIFWQLTRKVPTKGPRVLLCNFAVCNFTHRVYFLQTVCNSTCSMSFYTECVFLYIVCNFTHCV